MKDMIGNDHVLQHAPQRIVFTANIMPTFATLAGNLQSIIGTTALGRRGMKTALLDHVFPSSDEIASAGGNGNANLEEIMRLTPDAVFGWSTQKDVIGNLGSFEFVSFNTPRPLMSSHIALWQLLGILSGEDTKGRGLLNSYKDRIAAITSHLTSMRAQPLRVLVLISNGERFGIGPPRQYLDERFELVGAKNAAQTRFAGLFSIEDVVLLDPDIILIQGSSSEASPKRLFDSQVWQMIRAVRARKVYLVPDFPLFTLPVFDPLLVDWLAEIFHPELMPASLHQSVHDTYRDVYDFALSDDDIDQILAAEENAQSFGYARFARQTQ